MNHNSIFTLSKHTLADLLMSKGIERSLSINFSIKLTAFFVGIVLPTHWFLVSRPAWTYWQGHFIDYWAPKLFVSTIFVWILWGISLIFLGTTRYGQAVRADFRRFVHKHGSTLLFGVVILAIIIIQQVLSSNPLAGLTFLLMTLTGPGLLVGWIMVFKKRFLQPLILGIITGVFLQAGLTWYQFLTQSSLGGYWLLGQPHFSSYTNLETSQWLGALRFVPYGSTPHPNVLGAWLVLGVFLLLQAKINFTLRLVGCLTLATTVLLTESWSALLTLPLLGIILWQGPQIFRHLRQLPGLIILALIGCVQLVWYVFLENGEVLIPQGVHPLSWQRRVTLLEGTVDTMSRFPQGTGLLQHWTHFSPAIMSRLGTFVGQPVHSFVFSLGSDLGIWVLLLIITFLILYHKRCSLEIILLLSIFPIFSLDHFLTNTISGQYLLMTVILFLVKISREF